LPASFSNQKDLRFQITLGTGTFGSSDANQTTIQGFRASADIDHGGGSMFGSLNARIYGVSQSDMNAITTLYYQRNTALPNTIQVWAIDGDQQTLVFGGNIINAWGNYDSMPDVFLQITAQSALTNRLKPVSPSSYKGPQDVATIFSALAQLMGYQFENNGVKVTVNNPYLAGTGTEQAQSLAERANIIWGIENDQTLWICPANGSRPAIGQIPQISANSGMIGYPSFDGQGFVNFQCLFDPSIRMLGKVSIVSSIPRASGQRTVYNVAYKLESNKPGGAWFCAVRCGFDVLNAPSAP